VTPPGRGTVGSLYQGMLPASNFGILEEGGKVRGQLSIKVWSDRLVVAQQDNLGAGVGRGCKNKGMI
jgi:hypothetical protein